MLRNKLGKPTSNVNNQQTIKNDTNKNKLSNPTSNKQIDQKIQSTTLSQLHQTSINRINKPSVVHVANIGLNRFEQSSHAPKQPIIKSPVNTQMAKQIVTIQTKTQQQRLAQLVNKKAAQMKRQSQMINKISSQVGGQKRNFFKQYTGEFAHTLKIFKPSNQNTNQKQNFIMKSSFYEWMNISINQVGQNIKSNFKKDKYL